MSTSNRFKVVIPARYGSTRLPAKPLLEINDKPIFWHVAQRVLEAGVNISDIVIATDHQRIEEKAIDLKLPVAMTKSTHVSGTDRVNEVACQLNWHENTFVLNVQGDEPLIPSALIKALINFSQNNTHFEMFTASVNIKNYEDFINPNVVKAIVTENNQALYFTRSASPVNRDKPEDLTNANRHIGIYLYSVNILKKLCCLSESALESTEKLEQLRALSNGISIGVLKYSGDIPHGIDTEKDYLNVKAIMELI